MQEKVLCLKPGDKVRVIQDRGESSPDRWDEKFLIATKDSIGSVVSFEEYRADYEEKLRRYNPLMSSLSAHENHFSGVKRGMEKCISYPVRFEKVMPFSLDEDTSSSELRISVKCREGEIEVLDVYILEKIE